MIVIAGLGNPGARYAGNRHNIGFMAVDAIAARHRFAPWRRRFQSDCAEGTLAGVKCLLLKPQTFMNESGRALGEAARFYKLPPDQIVVIYDEIDLPPGKLRVKAGGGHAGHNGLRSIIAHIGADFRRVRIGVGHPGDKNVVQTYVLRDFPKSDHEWLDSLLSAVADHAPLLARSRDSSFMNKVHLALTPETAEADTNEAGTGEGGQDT